MRPLKVRAAMSFVNDIHGSARTARPSGAPSHPLLRAGRWGLVAVEEAREVGLADLGIAGRDVVELSGEHPLFELGDQREQVVERIDDEHQGLVEMDLEVQVE